MLRWRYSIASLRLCFLSQHRYKLQGCHKRQTNLCSELFLVIVALICSLVGLIRSDVQCKIFGVKTFIHEGHLGLFLCTRRSNTTAGRLGTFWLLDNLSVEKCRDIRRQFMISRLARWDRISKTGSCSNKKETIYLVNINKVKLYCHLTTCFVYTSC
jgi:hypothetical protein